MNAALRNPATRMGLGAVVAVAAVALPLGMASDKTISLLASAVIFGIAASGLGFLWGQSGQVNVGHAAVFGAGAYVSAVAADRLDTTVYSGLPLAIAGGALLALLFALASVRVSDHYFVILTFAMGEIFITFITRLESITGGISGLTALRDFDGFPGWDAPTPHQFYALCVGMLCAVLLVLAGLGRSRWGTTLRGQRDNPDLARSLGAAVTRHRLAAFTVSGACGGLAGHLYVQQVQYIAPDMFRVNLSLMFLVMVLLGGRHRLLGPLAGALVYTFLPEVDVGDPIRTQMAFGILLILLTIAFSEGLLSAPAQLKALFAGRRPETGDPIDHVKPAAGAAAAGREA